MEDQVCLYCKNHTKPKKHILKKFCSKECRYEYRKAVGYYRKYYQKKVKKEKSIRVCSMCDNVLPFHKSKYCCKQCHYLKLQLNRRARKMLKEGRPLSQLKIVKLNKDFLFSLFPTEVRAMIEDNKIIKFLTPIYYNDK